MNADFLIIEQKESFLTTQIRRLGAPLTIPSLDPSIPKHALEKILDSTNKKIIAHNRRTFGIESQAHVVEQIGTLYWNDILADGLPSRKAETCVRRDVDLTDSKNGVRTIPSHWEQVTLDDGGRASKKRRIDAGDSVPDNDNGSTHEAGREASTQNIENYEQLHVSLSAQIERREQLRQKLEELRKVQTLLKPFEDPKINIQPNLVTRDNTELENELSRMRILMAKVGSGLQRQNLQADYEKQDALRQVDQTEKEKLNELLNL